MTRPTARLLAALEILQARGTVSGSELARRLGVHPRTVRRYISGLEELGIPVTAETGRAGGYSLVAGFKLPPMMLTPDEALAVTVGLGAAQKLGIDDSQAGAESARAKLERVLPPPLRERARAIADTLQIGLAPTLRPIPASLLGELAAAVQRGRRLALQYRAGGAEVTTTRKVDPYGLAYRGQHWYAAGHCHLRGGLRTFRVDRIDAIEVLAEEFRRPPDFDLLTHLEVGLATLPRSHRAEVLCHCDLETAQRHIFGSLGTLESTESGVRLAVQVDDLDWLARQLAALPISFTIAGPPNLRSCLQRHAARLITATRLSTDTV